MKSDNYKIHLLLITIIVVLFNLHAVFGLDILIQDDNSRYLTAVNEEYRYDYPWRSFLGVAAELKWTLVSVMIYSAPMARLLVLLLLMVPLSLFFYLFNRQALNMPAWVALCSAVIVQLIPSMYEIPSFLDGSYVVSGLLAFVLTLLLTNYYLKSSAYSVSLFSLWFFAWVLANDLMGEMGVFLFPALLYLIFTSPGSLKKKLSLYSSALLIVSARLFLYLQTYGHPTNSVQHLQAEEIGSRIARSFEWWLPLPVGQSKAFILLSIAICVVGAILYRNKLSASLDRTHRRILIFYCLWFLASSFPFWFLSKNFTPRYFYIAFFALTAIIMLLIFRLWIKPSLFRNPLAITVMTVLFLWFGLARYWMTEPIFDRYNKTKQIVYNNLENEPLEPGMQIVMIIDSSPTAGYYTWSSGFFQHTFSETDLYGLLGPEIAFYNAFDPEACGPQHPMSCLDPDRPLIAFRYHQRMSYFLQWRLAGKQDSAWTLYHSNPSNLLEPIASGIGKDSYFAYLSRAGLDSDQVLWGSESMRR